MDSKSMQLVLFFLGLLLISSPHPTDARHVRSLFKMPRFTVEIRNGMVGHVLTSHCWSSEDDIGVHALYDNQEHHWSFKKNFWGTTKFRCKLDWAEGTQEFNAFYVDQDFFDNYCPNFRCVWVAKQDAIYGVNRDGKLDFKFYWKLVLPFLPVNKK